MRIVGILSIIATTRYNLLDLSSFIQLDSRLDPIVEVEILSPPGVIGEVPSRRAYSVSGTFSILSKVRPEALTTTII